MDVYKLCPTLQRDSSTIRHVLRFLTALETEIRLAASFENKINYDFSSWIMIENQRGHSHVELFDNAATDKKEGHEGQGRGYGGRFTPIPERAL